MGFLAVFFTVLAASAAAEDLYEVPPIDFDDYEMGNDIDVGQAWIDPRNRGFDDWKRNMIFFNLMKAMQNYRLNRPDYYEYANAIPNTFNVPEVKQPYAKRALDMIENAKVMSQEEGYSRPLPKFMAKKEKAPPCNFKFCARPPPSPPT